MTLRNLICFLSSFIVPYSNTMDPGVSYFMKNLSVKLNFKMNIINYIRCDINANFYLFKQICIPAMIIWVICVLEYQISYFVRSNRNKSKD